MPDRSLFLARSCFRGLIGALLIVATAAAAEPDSSVAIELNRDDAEGRLTIRLGGHDALTYSYGRDLDLVHYFPVLSPSGKSMTIEHPDPYPHHRSFWFADRVRLEGQRALDVYNGFYTRQELPDIGMRFRDRVRHVEFLGTEARPGQAVVCSKLVWEMDFDKPVLDETRKLRAVQLKDGEYFLDLEFVLTASYGEVSFTSDATHYAWPYVRMSPEFSVDQGGRMTNSEGGVNEAGTNGKVARWIDYSNTVGGVTEGLAIFSHPQNEHPHTWLTRNYGCFGPRRIEAKSGKPFVLKPGESIRQQVGVLVHRGDVETGQVAERYQEYAEGQAVSAAR
jgi:hypothetical protein